MPQTPEPERLQKVIARSGLSSRRAAEDLIAAGRVQVDGSQAHLGQKVDATSQRVVVDGVPLPTAPGLVYYLMNKPLGVVSTAVDTHDRRTVVDLVPGEPRVFPVGRLDIDTTGLLVLTNDGELTNLVTHPRHGVSKTYEVLVEGRLDRQTIRRLETGVDLDDGPARAVAVRIVDGSGNRTHLELVLREGRNRIIRRMCDAIEHPVVQLHRCAVGPLRDRTLKDGDWRDLTIGEVRALYEAAGETIETATHINDDSS